MVEEKKLQRLKLQGMKHMGYFNDVVELFSSQAQSPVIMLYGKVASAFVFLKRKKVGNDIMASTR